MARAQQIHPFEVERFVAGAQVVIVYASRELPFWHRFDDSLVTHYAGRASLAMLDLGEANSDLGDDWMHAWQEDLGWRFSRRLPDGFYFFLHGKARRFHPAPSLSPEHDAAKEASRQVIHAFADLMRAEAKLDGDRPSLFEASPSLIRLYELGVDAGRRSRK